MYHFRNSDLLYICSFCRHLDEREKLTDRVRELEIRINERDNDLKLLARKHQLETKLLRSQVQQENQKYREMSQKLQKTSVELARWTMTELNGGRCALPISFARISISHDAVDVIQLSRPLQPLPSAYAG